MLIMCSSITYIWFHHVLILVFCISFILFIFVSNINNHAIYNDFLRNYHLKNLVKNWGLWFRSNDSFIAFDITFGSSFNIQYLTITKPWTFDIWLLELVGVKFLWELNSNYKLKKCNLWYFKSLCYIWYYLVSYNKLFTHGTFTTEMLEHCFAIEYSSWQDWPLLYWNFCYKSKKWLNRK